MIVRYTRPAMGKVWSEENKFQKWLDVELAVCQAQADLGYIPQDANTNIQSKAKFDTNRVLEIEQEVKHDVIAFLTNVAEYVGDDSRFIHLGMTSNDVLDTSLSLVLREAGEILLQDITELKSAIKKQALAHKVTPCMGRTHGVHAEPVTFGLKMALWYEEMTRNEERLKRVVKASSVIKISGAVGTFEHLATEIRSLQRTEILEAEEYFSKGQKGSSAMPHKRNPITCERVAGLSRVLRGNAMAALENVSLWHERDITHSSVERIILPDSAILLDYMITQFTNIIDKLIVYPQNMMKNIERSKGLIFSQPVLLALAKKGLRREAAYKIVQETAMKVWESEQGSFQKSISENPEVITRLTPEELSDCFDLKHCMKNIDYLFKRAGL